MKRTSVTRRKIINTLLFMMPAFLLHVIFVSGSGVSMLYYSLTDWNGLGMPNFIGFKNYADMLTDRVLMIALVNNLKWLAVSLVVPITVALIVALALTKMKKSQMFYRTIVFIPYVVAPAVIGKVWVSLYNKYFGISRLLEILGINIPGGFAPLGKPGLSLFAVAAVDVWRYWVFVMLLLIAALEQVDPALYEVSDIEGASPLQKFWHVTVSQIRPALLTIFMTTIIGSFLTFEYIFVMTQGGPGQSSEVLATWIYKNAFQNFEAGYASSISVLTCFICGSVYFVFHYLQKKGWDV